MGIRGIKESPTEETGLEESLGAQKLQEGMPEKMSMSVECRTTISILN